MKNFSSSTTPITGQNWKDKSEEERIMCVKRTQKNIL